MTTRRKRTVDALMSQLGIPARAHPEAKGLLHEIEAHCGAPLAPAVAAFLRRSLHEVELEVPLDGGGHTRMYTWGAMNIADWSWETKHDDPYIARAVIVGDDCGDFVYVIDPANRIGWGPEAVYLVGKGSRSIDFTELVEPDLEAFLGRFVRQEWPDPKNVFALRDEEKRRSPPPLRTGDGRVLAAGVVKDPRFFPGADVLRSVRLRRPLTIDGRTFGRKPARSRGDTHPDLTFFPDGSVHAGHVAGSEIDGIALVPGSWVCWKPDGELHVFTPAIRTVIGGVACRAGAQIMRRASRGQFFFTPDGDTDYRGVPCKGGHRVDDYGGDLGLHFTSARTYQIAGRATVPPGVRVTTGSAGGASFELEVATTLDGRKLPEGTHVSYDGNGDVREIYVPDKKRR